MKKFISKILACIVSYAMLAGGAATVSAQVTGGPPTTSLPTSADGGAIGSGQLNFQPDLFSGRFTYTVPINVPPGRGNSQPKLALNYNSSVGNGWCGVGWQLEIGKIERETRFGVPVLYPTNGLPLGQYDDGKSFTVDMGGIQGHLVQVSATGQSPAQYRLQVDKSFLTFLYYTNVANAYWTVTDKNGEQFFFGESASNRLDNRYFTNSYGSETFRWALDRIVDADGNETLITYTNAQTTNSADYGGQLYPIQISYNGSSSSPSLAATNTITFVLTNRTDKTTSFVSAFRMENDYLLSQIIIKAAGQKVRRYALNYTTSSSTYRSLLTSVTEYGSDDASSLPSTTFNYQVEQFGFGPLQSWAISSQGETNLGWNSITAVDTNGNTYVNFVDMDGDGLPDRVMIKTNAPYNGFIVQRNTGANFVDNYFWGGLNNQGNSDPKWGNLATFTNGITSADFFDIDGDGRPDRVITNFSSSGTNSWVVQLNTGTPATNGFSSTNYWGSLASGYPDNIHAETNFASTFVIGQAEMIDINGDGLPDRVLAHDFPSVQLNTGNGFSRLISYPNLADSVYVLAPANGTYAQQMLIDLNGDGLPDLVYCLTTNFQVFYGTGQEINNAAGSLGDNYFPILSEQSGVGWNTANFTGVYGVGLVKLIDINGDGLPDRVMTKAEPPFDRFKVQLNTGSGFGPLIDWTNVESQAGTNNQNWDSIGYVDNNNNTLVALIDINGDGLPDRVMAANAFGTNIVEMTNIMTDIITNIVLTNHMHIDTYTTNYTTNIVYTTNTFQLPYTNFMVQLNLGPFPDLLCGVSNGLGGSVQVTYLPSTRYDNTDRVWTNDPWAEGAKSLLPFPVYTVSSIAVNDGFGNLATNTYTYQHGYFDHVSREFRGFGTVAVTDPFGEKTVSYFHQSGGFDGTANGEFQDQGSFSKKGMPYRVETWGTNGLLYQLVLNKVNEYILNTNGWYFPCVTQTVVMNYEGLSSYRATAVQYTYDTNTENLIAEADLGEVANVVLNGQTFTQLGSNSVFKWISYTNIGNILNRPIDTKITSDSGGANRLRETINAYDGNGNLKSSQSWLNTSGSFITTVANNYDQYGNLTQTTDPAGITTTIAYDSTFEQFPVSQTVGSFTSYSTFDNRSGELFSSTDIKGLVSSNSYDVFFRPTAAYISTTSNGPPVLWQTKMSYLLDGISNSVSYNCSVSQVNDAVDPVNGFVTYTYADGMGRTIETRDESETANQYRVANVVYDPRGNPFFSTLPYFSSGTNYTVPNATYLGSLTAYDSIGRAFQSTPAVNGAFSSGILTGVTATGGDSGSPVGPTTTAFLDGSNPWATLVTDANGKVTKSYRDAFGRSVTNTQVTVNGNVNTVYVYDLLGNLTSTIDSAGNSTTMTYDSLGRKTSMVDPDMGTWTYAYDNDNRLIQQTDARNNTIQFNYGDALGRLTAKQIYNSANALVGNITYQYDSSSGDPNYTVYPGQLYKVTDLQGYERFSYDLRGRTLKDSRLISVNAMEYTTQATYDDADRIQQLTYPGGVATIQYSYDAAGHLSQVKSTAGTTTNEVFYTPQSFNALDQLAGCTYGNGVATTYSYYPNSTRLQNITGGVVGTNYQNLTYQYDNCSDVTNVNDGVNPSGVASATINGIAYDDLYRVTSINSAARGTKTYGYNSIGNLLTNQDFGAGTYQYGAQPHMVTSANGTNYGYDACGNITARGNQALTYDAQNQLIRVSSTNDSVAFGYDDSGERLWRAGTNGYTVWIGGIYEINNGKVLCHVIAGGQLIATFEPECNAGLAKVFGQKNWYAASTGAKSIVSWPFRNGRGQWTLFCGAWLGILGICMAGSRGIRLKQYEWRRALHFHSLWKQAVTLLCISAMLWAGTGRVEAAPAYNPVFYFYSTDYLGSSNILTDNSGNLVQHYEYSTFGQTAYQNNTSAFPVSNRYTGQIADDETGLMYYGGRYYDPQLARFIQPDPTVPDTTDSQSFNRYSYCRNNPLNEIDPSGFDDTAFPTGLIPDGPINPDNDFFNFFFGNDNFNFNIQITITITFTSTYTPPQIPPITLAELGGNADDFAGPDYGAINSYSAPPTAFGTPNVPTPDTSPGRLLNATNTALTIASLAPGPVGSIASAAQAGLDLVQGHYVEAGIDGAGIVLSFVGLGFAAKAIKLAREARLARDAEALTADAAKAEMSSSKALGENLEAAGITRPQNSAAHHIVAGNDPRAAEARAILQKEGIGINDAENGIFLPKNTKVLNPTGAQVHTTVHTDLYYNSVNAALRNAPPGTARDVLEDIANQLQSGTFPH